ncbi:MAG: tRNA1Val (adenine37-N6)-methyltransferase [Flavobacteriales bacterium]
MKAFKFKHFQLFQDQCAMKIGTDGCLLGAWAKPDQAVKALDIGTGTGLVACMLAQRFPNLQLDALELDSLAAAQATANVEGSPFQKRINVHEVNFLTWKKEGYDYIVCNPPFFEEASSSANEGPRIQARQEKELSIGNLLSKAFECSTSDARMAIVWPARREAEALEAATKSGWCLIRTCALFPTPTKAVHRVLLEFSKQAETVVTDKLVIEEFGRHQYSEAYKSLLKDFYLKF